MLYVFIFVGVVFFSYWYHPKMRAKRSLLRRLRLEHGSFVIEKIQWFSHEKEIRVRLEGCYVDIKSDEITGCFLEATWLADRWIYWKYEYPDIKKLKQHIKDIYN